MQLLLKLFLSRLQVYTADLHNPYIFAHLIVISKKNSTGRHLKFGTVLVHSHGVQVCCVCY
jgi:hypothetical protein